MVHLLGYLQQKWNLRFKDFPYYGPSFHVQYQDLILKILIFHVAKYTFWFCIFKVRGHHLFVFQQHFQQLIRSLIFPLIFHLISFMELLLFGQVRVNFQFLQLLDFQAFIFSGLQIQFLFFLYYGPFLIFLALFERSFPINILQILVSFSKLCQVIGQYRFC